MILSLHDHASCLRYDIFVESSWLCVTEMKNWTLLLLPVNAVFQPHYFATWKNVGSRLLPVFPWLFSHIQCDPVEWRFLGFEQSSVRRIQALITNLLVELNVIWTQLTQDIPGFFCHGIKKQIYRRQAAVSNGVTLSRDQKTKQLHDYYLHWQLKI